MGRYTGATERRSRRKGVELEGLRRLSGKCGLGPQPPGRHGDARRRGNVSVCALQLREGRAGEQLVVELLARS